MSIQPHDESTMDPNAGMLEVPAFLGMTEQQSRLLVALYNETDPEFAKQMPTALPIAAQQLAAEYEKRNNVGKKLERANHVWSEEYKLFDTIQREAVEKLSTTDMNIDKAAEGLSLDEDQEASIHDLIMGSLLYGGIRREPSGPDDRASMSPVASPNFEGAKRLLERAFEKGYSMAAVQIGSFFMQEEKLAGGANLKQKTPTAKELAYNWYKKAADASNPMACHKLGFFLENGIGCEKDISKAIEYYTKAYEEGYPDSAHNLGIIYQGFTQETSRFRDIKKAIEYFERAKQWGFSASCNALGRMYLLMSKNADLAKEAGNPGSEPEDYVVTGIELMEDAANNGDADAMMMLGLIFGSKDYGLYDMDKAQNYMELALVRGDLEAYNYLVRILRAKMAARVALEKENFDNFEKLSQADQEKLIRQLAKEAASDNISHRHCAHVDCDKREEEPGSFKRCGRCQRVAYCSRECQKEHWKAGHKAV
ncbi:putative beta-lactamase HcpC, partial [Choanephora cucurbitarum]